MRYDYVGYGGEYPNVRWPNEARLAVSIVVHYEEGAEQSPIDGDEGPEQSTNPIEPPRKQRDLGIESLYEYGPRCGIWRLLRIFDETEVKVSFFCAGRALEQNPYAAHEITARGHEACGHGYRWVPYYSLTRVDEKIDIQRAIAAIESTTGQRPLGWHSRTPSENTRQLLIESGFLYDSDSYDDDIPYFVKVSGKDFLTVPYAVDTSDAKFWPPPLVAGFSKPDDFFQILKATFDRLYEEGSDSPRMMSVSLRLRISGHPSRASQVMRFIQYAKQTGRVWFARRIDIARWWLDHYALSS